MGKKVAKGGADSAFDRKELLRRASLLGEWMLRNQVKNPMDANCGRGIGTYNPASGHGSMSVNWTTGLMCACFCALYKRTGRKEYLDAAVRAGRYVMSLQVLDRRDERYYGLFRELTPQSVECAPRDATSAAWGLVWLYNSTGEREYLDRADIFGRWHLNHAMVGGWPRWALYMNGAVPDMYAQGCFQSGTGLFYHDLFMAGGNAQYIERGLRPIAVGYRDRFFNPDGSVIGRREAFSGRVPPRQGEAARPGGNDDFGAAMLQAAADFFRDESFREKARAFARHLAAHQDADGGFADGRSPSGVPVSLMYYHDLGTHYGDDVLLAARTKTLRKLFSMQTTGGDDERMRGAMSDPVFPRGGGAVRARAAGSRAVARTCLYALMALLKLESDLPDVWLGRFNRRWTDDGLAMDVAEKLGYTFWLDPD